jgi:hypothetical protein
MNPNDTIRTGDYQRPSHSADVIAALVRTDRPTGIDFIGIVRALFVGDLRKNFCLNSRYPDWHTRADVSALLFLLAFFLRFGNLITACMPDAGKSNRRVMTDESNN